jgi:hypothetical protein
MRLLAAIAVLVCMPALAVGPQNVSVTFTTRTGGGPVSGHRLYINDALAGTVATGVFTTTPPVPGNGTYKFCVRAFNATAEAPDGNCQTRALSDLAPAMTQAGLTCSVVTPP